MTYTVAIHWTTHVQYIEGLSRAQAVALADHTKRAYSHLVVETYQGGPR